METLHKEELQNIEGGILKVAVSKWMVGFGAALTFLLGVFNGYTNGTGACR